MNVYLRFPVPRAVSSQLERIAMRATREVTAELKPLEAYHLTLLYLGKIDPFHMETISEIISDTFIRHTLFAPTFHLHRLDIFRIPESLLVGRVIVEPDLPWLQLRNDLIYRLGSTVPYANLRKWNPHITLAEVDEDPPGIGKSSGSIIWQPEKIELVWKINSRGRQQTQASRVDLIQPIYHF